MTTRILHVTLGSASFALQQFARGNPHGVIRQPDKTVTTFGVVHYFRTIRSLEDCENLRGMNFNCIIYEELDHTNLEAYQWLASRCREPKVYPSGFTLKLTVPEKE